MRESLEIPGTLFMTTYDKDSATESHESISLDEAARFLVGSSEGERDSFLDDLLDGDPLAPLKSLAGAASYGFSFADVVEHTADEVVEVEELIIGISIHSAARARAMVALFIYDEILGK